MLKLFQLALELQYLMHGRVLVDGLFPPPNALRLFVPDLHN